MKTIVLSTILLVPVLLTGCVSARVGAGPGGVGAGVNVGVDCPNPQSGSDPTSTTQTDWVPGHVGYWNGQNIWISGHYGFRQEDELRSARNPNAGSSNASYAFDY